MKKLMNDFSEAELKAHFHNDLVSLFSSMPESQLAELGLRGGRLCVQLYSGPFTPRVRVSLGDPDNSENHDGNFLEQVQVHGQQRQTMASYVHTKFDPTGNLEFDEAEGAYVSNPPAGIRAEALALVHDFAEELSNAFIQHPRLRDSGEQG